MKFTKMNGLGNDYVFIDESNGYIPDPAGMAVILSDRHRGVGSDGIVLIGRSETADCRMRMYNADGSEGETCGNALRCIGKYLFDKGLIKKHALSVQTKAGIARIYIVDNNGTAARIKVNMGRCTFVDNYDTPQAIDTSIGRYYGYAVTIGNPHFVIFTAGLTDRLMTAGKEIADNAVSFPHGTNVEFVKVTDDDRLEMRVYERGTGETQACGSGAAASFFVAEKLGKIKRKATVTLPGGELICSCNGDDEILIEGDAEFGFEGEIKEEYTLWQRLI